MLSAKADRSILERIPIIREWNGYFKLKDGSSLDILELRCKDLERVSDDELELDIMYFSKLYKNCTADLKIVSLNFPTDTIPQQRYFRRKLESTKNHVFRSHLGQCLQEAEWIQKHRTKREYYLFVFSDKEFLRVAVRLFGYGGRQPRPVPTDLHGTGRPGRACHTERRCRRRA